jgi:uncharacterized protein (TIGR03435 family)
MTELAAAAPLLLKVTVVLSLGLLLVRLAASQSAAHRHVIASATLAAAALMPFAALWFPPISVVLQTRDSREPLVPSASPGPTRLQAGPTDQKTVAALPIALLGGWAAGAAVCVLPLLAAGYQSRRIRRQGQLWAVRETTVPTLRGWRRREIPVLVHTALSTPVVCGIVRPAIALPTSAARWCPRDIERALVHEMAHLGRGDVVVQTLARLVCAAYWFHPLVWICWRRLRLEAERACDDAVIARFEASDYASQLVRIARGLTGDVAASVLPAMTRHGELRVRIESILDTGRLRSAPSTSRALPAILLGVAAASWLACITPTTAYVVRASSAQGRFAVASIRESPPTGTMMLVRNQDGSVHIKAATVQVLIRLAYDVQASAIVDAPAWLSSVRYDIHAAPHQPASAEATVSMLRVLLAERFGLRVAQASRLQRVVVVELPRSFGGLRPPTRCASTPISAATGPTGSVPFCGFQVGPGHIQATAVDAEALAATLSTAFGQRVLVEPADGGRFDMRLRWLTTGGHASPLMEALRTQAGAIVSERERPMPVLAIHSVHRPT